MALRLLKLPEVCARRGERPTSLYAAIKDQRMTPPVKIARRLSAWPEHEVDAVTAALVAGADGEQIRRLVRQLCAQRSSLMPKIESVPK